MNITKSIMETTTSQLNPNETITSMVDEKPVIKRIVQKYMLIWADENIDPMSKNCQDTMEELRCVISDIQMFNQLAEFSCFLADVDDYKIFLIISEAFGTRMIPYIHSVSQLVAIYISCVDRKQNEDWIKEWPKIKGVNTQIQPICDDVKLAIKQYHQDSIAMSFVEIEEGNSSTDLNRLESSFMYTQLFKTALLDMDHTKQEWHDLVRYCQNKYAKCSTQLNLINEFGQSYDPDKAIWWYTRECFTYQMVNQALRLLQGDIIVNMGFFICDIHRQIERLYNEQLNQNDGKPSIVYRGQRLSTEQFDKLMRTRGGLLYFNSFLSTSRNKHVARVYADVPKEENMVGVLFVMTIDPTISVTAYADIQTVSYFNIESEILFTMHTGFHVERIIKCKDETGSFFEVQLTLTADVDEQLHALTTIFQEETKGIYTGWKLVGHRLIQIGQVNKAEELYLSLLEQASNQDDQAFYNNQLGVVQVYKGCHNEAADYYKAVINIREKTLTENHLALVNPYNNIAVVYDKIAEYSKALSYYEKSLTIQEKILPEDHCDLATSCNNIGLVYIHLGEYPKAASYLEKAINIRRKILPEYHPSLASCYNNIGGVYKHIGNYPEALSYYEKAIDIQERTLPEDHPDLVTTYSNIGVVYENNNEYSKALSYYEKSLSIRQRTLSPNHPDLATAYDNIAGVYDNMGEHSKALSQYETALNILKENAPESHPQFIVSFNNIAGAYMHLKEYSQALFYFDKALNIFKKTHPEDHSELATFYNNIGEVYNNMKKYSEALFCYKLSLDILKKTLSDTHPYVVLAHSNIGRAYYNMRDYSKAVSHYEIAINIQAKTLGKIHPSLLASYANIAIIYSRMGKYL